MHKRAALLLALTCNVAISQAQGLTIGPRITGERLIAKLTPVDPATVTPNRGSVLTRESLAEFYGIVNYNFYDGYITALHDATEGRAWCYNKKYKIPKGDALSDETRQALFSLSSEQLKRNAAELLVEIWSKKWPCPARDGRQK